MKSSISIEYKHLKAISLFTSTDETRYVLNGVFVESSQSETLLVATNGRGLAVLNAGSTTGDAQKFIIPNRVLKMAFAMAGRCKSKPLLVTFDSEENSVSIKVSDQTISCPAITGNYPAWRKVIPKDRTNKTSTIGLGGKYLKPYLEACSILNRESGIGLSIAGELDCVFIKLTKCPEFFGVLMPFRIDSIKDWNTPFKLADAPLN